MNQTDKITKDELQKIAEGLAKKYKSKQEFEDLVQEGVLAGLEKLQTTNEKGLVISAMRSALRDYFNVSLSTLSVPKSGAAKTVISKIRAGRPPEGTVEKEIFNALTCSVEPIEANTIREDPFSCMENNKSIFSLMEAILDEEGFYILCQLYLEERSVESLSKELGIARSTLNRRKEKALGMLKDIV